MKDSRKFVLVFILLAAVIALGVAGYSVLLDVGFVDALYMTAITISTVGYGEIRPMSDPAKLFSILIIFAGLSVVGYGITSFVALFFEGRLKDAWRKKRMDSTISRLTGHYIVCGAGDVGVTVIKNLSTSGAPFVVIEENEKKAEELVDGGVLTIEGDATNEDTLKKAGIDKARGIVCTLKTDSENVFTVLTARQMNAEINIVAKAVEPSAHNKLMKAGANKTISPSEIGGQRIAAHLVRPSIVSFLDVMTRAGDLTLDLEEITINPNSALVGQYLHEAKIPERTGLMILAIKSPGEQSFRFNPSSSECLGSGDTMVVLGTKEQAECLSAIVNA